MSSKYSWPPLLNHASAARVFCIIIFISFSAYSSVFLAVTFSLLICLVSVLLGCFLLSFLLFPAFWSLCLMASVQYFTLINNILHKLFNDRGTLLVYCIVKKETCPVFDKPVHRLFLRNCQKLMTMK